MANIVTMTKGAVSLNVDTGIYSVPVNFIINDGASDILVGTVNTKYNPTEPDLVGIENRLKSDIKSAWDKYVAEIAVRDAAAFDTMITSLESQANAYVNS